MLLTTNNRLVMISPCKPRRTIFSRPSRAGPFWTSSDAAAPGSAMNRKHREPYNASQNGKEQLCESN